MSEVHSIWLMPGAADEALFRSDIEELALRFGVPRFQPHLTLAGDVGRGADELAPLAAEIASGLAAFDAPVLEIGAGDLYFRCLYVLFANAGPLRELEERAIAGIAPAELDAFMPHISLLYGVPDGPEKRAARARMAERWVGRLIRFDRVAVVSSGKEIPVAEWAIRFSASLCDLG